jgi:hypothetical protein
MTAHWFLKITPAIVPTGALKSRLRFEASKVDLRQF